MGDRAKIQPLPRVILLWGNASPQLLGPLCHSPSHLIPTLCFSFHLSFSVMFFPSVFLFLFFLPVYLFLHSLILLVLLTPIPNLLSFQTSHNTG